uniref:Tyrosine aminotransferase n=1 Tax=Syphacia muris TaxID=451379 RepID=A0A0N5AR10_9BILA
MLADCSQPQLKSSLITAKDLSKSESYVSDQLLEVENVVEDCAKNTDAPSCINSSKVTQNVVWPIHPVSQHASSTRNPIREICDKLSTVSISKKRLIKLDLGDPSATGLFPPSPTNKQALLATVSSHKYVSYGPAVGHEEVRNAIVRHFSTPAAPFTSDDVILTSGCSHALQLAIEALADPGDNILVPCPGFPLYLTLLKPHGIQGRFYQIVLNDRARIDLPYLESLIDEKTRAIIVNNPSNPLGAVYPKQHLEAILQIAFNYKIPIIADEVYGQITFNNTKFYPLATLQPKVPIITCDGISKRYLSPGARLGWLIIHDHCNVFKEVRKGLVSLAQKICGPSTLIQSALPYILDKTPQSFFDNMRQKLEINANVAYSILSQIPGLYPVKPEGAMYMSVGINEAMYGTDKEFLQKLIYEQNVFCLPGTVFFCSSMFRMALIFPKEVIVDACCRIKVFCLKYYTSKIENLRKISY